LSVSKLILLLSKSKPTGEVPCRAGMERVGWCDRKKHYAKVQVV